ncbi:MAG: hypothetical protein ABJD07_17475, partial [Gemmatimonadaceae bacterium]
GLGVITESILEAYADHVATLQRGYEAALAAQRFMSQPFAVATQFTGIPGQYVKLEDTISSFERLVAGEFDTLPEQAFFMAGTIDDVIKNAEKQAKG